MEKIFFRYYLGAGAALSPINVIAVAQLNTSQTAATNFLQGEWQGCGMQKVAGSFRPVGGTLGGDAYSGNWSVTNTFTMSGAGCDTILVNATALMNGTGAGNQTFAQANFTAATLSANDQLNTTWFLWLQ